MLVPSKSVVLKVSIPKTFVENMEALVAAGKLRTVAGKKIEALSTSVPPAASSGMAYVVMAYVVMDYIVYSYGLCSYGLYSI